MSLSPAVLDAMLAAGCSAEQIAAIVKADMAEAEARRAAKRANNAERQRRFKAKNKAQGNAGNALPPLGNAGLGFPDKEAPQTPKEINPIPCEGSAPAHEGSARLKVKGGVVAIPDWVPAEPWAGFVAMRRKSGHPLTERAAELTIRELRKLSDAGHPPGDMLDLATRNGWRTVYAPKDRSHDRQSSRHSNRPRLLADAFADGMAAMGR